MGPRNLLRIPPGAPCGLVYPSTSTHDEGLFVPIRPLLRSTLRQRNRCRHHDLDALTESIQQLTRSGSDIRGRFISDDDDIQAAPKDGIPALTPLAAYCLGQGLARQLRETFSSSTHDDKSAPITVGLGMDPRWHGTILADALARGLTSASTSSESLIKVKFNTQICTTPAMATFCRMEKCQAAVVRTILRALPVFFLELSLHLFSPPCCVPFSRLCPADGHGKPPSGGSKRIQNLPSRSTNSFRQWLFQSADSRSGGHGGGGGTATFVE